MPEEKLVKPFRGFLSPNYTSVPDELFDELLPELSGSELKVLLYIIRRTFGFKRDADTISLSPWGGNPAKGEGGKSRQALGGETPPHKKQIHNRQILIFRISKGLTTTWSWSRMGSRNADPQRQTPAEETNANGNRVHLASSPSVRS
jgi:hypothetical protein